MTSFIKPRCPRFKSFPGPTLPLFVDSIEFQATFVLSNEEQWKKVISLLFSGLVVKVENHHIEMQSGH